jgi:hypothetical protein
MGHPCQKIREENDPDDVGGILPERPAPKFISVRQIGYQSQDGIKE